jgi:hypothetical protein
MKAEGTSRRLRCPPPPLKEYLEGRSSREERQRHESWDERLERRRAQRRGAVDRFCHLTGPNWTIIDFGGGRGKNEGEGNRRRRGINAENEEV